MSGNVPSFPFPASIGDLPAEGSKVVSITIPWASAASPFPINLLSQYQSGQFTAIQSLLVDNSTQPFDLTITSLEFGWSITAPGFTIGQYPLLCGPTPNFIVTPKPSGTLVLSSANTAGTTKLYFLNTPRGSFENRRYGPGGAFLNYSNRFTLANWGVPGSNTALITGTGAQHVAIRSFSLTLQGQSAAGEIEDTVILYEQPASGGLSRIMWQDFYSVPAGSDAVVYSRFISFEYPLIAQRPNPVWLGGLNPTATAVNVALNITYDLVTVS